MHSFILKGNICYSISKTKLRQFWDTLCAWMENVQVFSRNCLMDLMEETGLVTYVGKINMDRSALDELVEESADMSAFNTFGWIYDIAGKYKRTKPILTPMFIPSCTDELMDQLREIQRAHSLPVQSHLSENKGEIE